MNKEQGIKIFGEDWYEVLEKEVNKDYFTKIGVFLKQEREERGKKIYPDASDYFKAFRKTPFGQVKVVIIGQDCYHDGSADGLAFSSKKEFYTPPSLKIIFDEVERSLNGGLYLERYENLERWAEQGIFLLNRYLSVEEKLPKSHSRIGWEEFTSTVIKEISINRNQVVFMLWGADAKQVKYLIDGTKHLILEAGHPAAGFYGTDTFSNCKHFSLCNEYLKLVKKQEIKW